jgi:hypothetical protein
LRFREFCIIGDEDRLRDRVMLRLREQIRGDEVGISSAVG